MCRTKRLFLVIAPVAVLFVLMLGIFALAAQTDGYTRELSVKNITVTANGKKISGVYSDPANYWEIVNNNALDDLRINLLDVGAGDAVIYTPLYPYTTTGRKGDFVEYVCQPSSGRYYVTSVNNSGDGTTYIPIGGFVLSLPRATYSSFASVGDSVTLGGSSLSIPTRAVESSKGYRVTIDKTNTKRSGPMVVYYNRDYGIKTSTNIYGTEMACQYDLEKKTFVVTEFRDFLTGDASGIDIPENGFVLSAYGEGYRQLLAKRHLFDLGDEVKIVGFSFVSLSANTVKNEYNRLLSDFDSIVGLANERISKLYDLDTSLINSYVHTARSKLSRLEELRDGIVSGLSDPSRPQGDLDAMMMEFSECRLSVEELCQSILVATAESRVVSARSAWHRPCEKSYSEIKESVETFKRVGINLIFVETLYHGCSAFKSDVSAFPYHPSLSLTYTDTDKNVVYDDYLSAFLACCLDYGIEVHVWVENFYVGIDKNASVLKNHPDWIMYNDDGSILQRREGGQYIFIDPANEEVQDTLLSYYDDLFTKHPEIKGLNLDYIRYPVSGSSQDTGYTAAAMIGFYDSLGYKFTDAQLVDREKMANKFKQLFDKNYLPGGQAEVNQNYSLWVKYRTQIITDYVLRIKNEIKDRHGILLSTAVFASLSESLDSKKADWQSWFNRGWIDIVTPMAYYTTSSAVESNVKNMISYGGANCLYYTGIASSYSGFPAWQNKEFIEASYRAGSCGYVIFSSAQILGHPDVQLSLSSGVNSKWAVLPHADIESVLSASFDDILDKTDRLFIPAGGMTEQGKKQLEVVFVEILGMLNGRVSGVYNAYERLCALLDGELTEIAHGNSYDRIEEQLDSLCTLLDSRISIQLIRDGKWDPQITPTRPEIEDDEDDPTVTPDDDIDEPSDDPEDPTDPEEPDDPPSDGNESDGQSGEEQIGWFRRLLRAIAAFFRRLFGIRN